MDKNINVKQELIKEKITNIDFVIQNIENKIYHIDLELNKLMKKKNLKINNKYYKKIEELEEKKFKLYEDLEREIDYKNKLI